MVLFARERPGLHSRKQLVCSGPKKVQKADCPLACPFLGQGGQSKNILHLHTHSCGISQGSSSKQPSSRLHTDHSIGMSEHLEKLIGEESEQVIGTLGLYILNLKEKITCSMTSF